MPMRFPPKRPSCRKPLEAQRVIEAGEAAKRHVIDTVEVHRAQEPVPKPSNEEKLSTFEVEMLRAWSLP